MTSAPETTASPPKEHTQRPPLEHEPLRLAMRPLHNAHVEQVDGRHWTLHGWSAAAAGALIGFSFAVVSILSDFWCHTVPAPTISGVDTACPQNTGLAAGLLFSTLAGAVAAPALWLGAVGLIDIITAALHDRHQHKK